ncbi:TatD family hydrolase [Flammeovirga sp. EKP202]|uniref:TatD family hydrolase n=1 Tax=Flammeovirga sp. EKP202 TaxID=2770592 RepID=UPI00165EE9F4|nr:TatD family hydrolase [Flammeovirga sp. EKP202]MBD0400365.1 TatD family hydrolase [Flammeovirga sp. EKP202]
MHQYFNSHTHHPTGHGLELVNQFIQDDFSNSENLVSAGIHPWHLDKVELTSCFLKLEKQAENLSAIGETGLDRVIEYPLEEQKVIFKRHIDIAEHYQKPMIIHCVRAYSDVLQLRKEMKPKMPWIFHGFMGNLQIARQIIDRGCFLSFGKGILQQRPKLHQVIQETPSQFHLFETDDAQDLKIEEVYQRGALLYGKDLNEVVEEKLQIAKNLFPKINDLL